MLFRSEDDLVAGDVFAEVVVDPLVFDEPLQELEIALVVLDGHVDRRVTPEGEGPQRDAGVAENLLDDSGERGGLTATYFSDRDMREPLGQPGRAFPAASSLPPDIADKVRAVRWTGSLVPGSTGDYGLEDVLAVARHAEATGWDGVWIADHFYGFDAKTDPFMEAWTTLTWIAATCASSMPIRSPRTAWGRASR